MRRVALCAVAVLVGLAAVPLLATAGHADAANPLAGVVSAEVESFAVRAEYDIPLPAGPGTIAHVVGEIGRSQAGESAKGISGAPTHLDAVVGGTYADPDKDVKGDERNLPQTECAYPGHLLDTRFAFPTDTQKETAGLPPTAYATARCGAGPEVELHALGTEASSPAALSTKSAASDALARPVKGALESTTATRADGVSILAGAITVGSIELSGASHITGKAGDQRTTSRVALHDVSAGGATFSIADDQLVLAGQSVPLDSPTAQAFFDGVNAGLAPTGCRMAAATNPGRYPQGFLFGRPEPKVGVEADGTFAASYRAGLFVFCDLPASVTDNAKVGNDVFSPQRTQIVLGFVYTSVTATSEPGGFSLGDLFTGGAAVPAVAGLGATAPPAPVVPDLSSVGTDAAPAPSLAPAPGRARPRPAAFIHFGPMKASTRWALALGSFVVWAALTHLGARRLRGVLGR